MATQRPQDMKQEQERQEQLKQEQDKRAQQSAAQQKQQEQQKAQTPAQQKEQEQEKEQGRKPDSAAMDKAENEDGQANQVQKTQTGEPRPELAPGQPSGPDQDGSFPSMGGIKAPTDPEAAPKTPPEGPTVYPAKE